MIDPNQQPTVVLGQEGGPCAGCGAPLAADQRYCLNCGVRRGEPRIDFRRLSGRPEPGGDQAPAAPPPPLPAATPPPSEPESVAQRDYAPLVAVGGIAVLGLMLLVGVLIGRGDGGDQQPPPAQVVIPGAAATGAGEPKPEGTANAGARPRKKAPAKKSAAPTNARKADDASDLTAGGGGGGPVEASDDALQELEEKSPSEYSKESAKLPDEIAIGGAPPPEDGKAPGGGSKGTAIE
jgi:hypothetical protein